LKLWQFINAKPAPAAQADNVGNAEKRKVAPLGECGLC